ncbi:hypothetical protein MKW94_002962 [Papaver nudicaule]|uniref:3-hydroxyacyl-[acyl-carrier-protein] dehydratase n=1 Tax=Papaver nudicaule TaxID=74823 RepID=A0AA41SC46_PAPNU|nr:hypothetical protein [Papaver nudicaule]
MEATALTNHIISGFSCNSSSSQASSTHQYHSLIPATTNSLKYQKIILSSNPRSHFHRRNLTACSSVNGVEDTVKDVPIEKQFPAYPAVMDINKIREILPHRYPFLLVDRVIEYNAGVSAVAIKNVTINDNFFPGHFPERPIMPGVLMIEAMAQVGGVVMLQPEVGGSQQNFFFAGIDKVRFRKPVIAGDTLVMRMTLIKLQKRFGIAKMEGKAYVGGEVVCEGEFLMATGSSE